MLTDYIDKCTDETSFFLKIRSYLERIFGELSKVKADNLNPDELVKQLSANGVELLRIFQVCGTVDSMLEVNRRMWDYMTATGIELTCKEELGTQKWNFWNKFTMAMGNKPNNSLEDELKFAGIKIHKIAGVVKILNVWIANRESF